MQGGEKKLSVCHADRNPRGGRGGKGGKLGKEFDV